MDKDDTKYCKDCALYSQPHCNRWAGHVYTARRATCDKWTDRAKPTRAEHKGAK